jgi:oligopeptide/dipeptide ABC transporter ATP-binding protein
MALLEVRDLRITFPVDGGALAAVRGAGFEIARGEIVGLLGESGCGKSSTALAILGLLPASATCSGSICFDSQELLGLSEQRMEKTRGAQISLISQEPALALNPVLTVRRQISEVLRAHQNSRSHNSESKINALLELVGLTDVSRIASAYPHQISGGQRQRVAIAQALACKPVLVIADEPTASLDTVIQAEILEVFLQLKQSLGSAFLFISHNPAILQKICDRILVMYAGEIVEQGPAARVLSQPLHPYTRALLACAPARPHAGQKKPRYYIAGSPPDMQRPISACAFESRCPDRMEVCTMRPPVDIAQDNSRHVRCFKYGGC